MADDSFEVARKVFFGAGNTTSGLKASPGEFLKPPNETLANNKSPAAFADEGEGAQPRVFGPSPME